MDYQTLQWVNKKVETLAKNELYLSDFEEVVKNEQFCKPVEKISNDFKRIKNKQLGTIIWLNVIVLM